MTTTRNSSTATDTSTCCPLFAFVFYSFLPHPNRHAGRIARFSLCQCAHLPHCCSSSFRWLRRWIIWDRRYKMKHATPTRPIASPIKRGAMAYTQDATIVSLHDLPPSNPIQTTYSKRRLLEVRRVALLPLEALAHLAVPLAGVHGRSETHVVGAACCWRCIASRPAVPQLHLSSWAL
jgi:hypothetical protein